ncbi:MAG: serine/threonine protein kinase [Gemmatimonadetes bacterium]|nr:serine/threonine protein kinase [Gemmatimonadota bacterium]
MSLTSAQWERLSIAFADGLELAPSERRGAMERALHDDVALLHEGLEMLGAHEDAGELQFERRFVAPAEATTHGSLTPGTHAGAYRVEALHGEGGMAEIYRAERVVGGFGQTVALKVLRPTLRSAEFTRRFEAERQLLARLVHPDIVPILDGGETADGRPFLVMPLVVGEPITTHVRRGAQPRDARLRLFCRVAAAVQFAHARLVVHRDLKPSNILVDTEDGIHLLDFGIAKLLDDDASPSGSERRTRTNVRLLTPEHAAPEQLADEGVTTATDVYALGILLFELLTGRRPWQRGVQQGRSLEQEILHGTPPSPSAVVGDRAVARQLRGDLDRIVLMALRREPERRYQSAGQFGEDVQRYLDGMAVMAQPDRVGYRVRKFLGRNRSLAIAGALLLATLATSSVVATLQARRLTRERDRSERERASAEAAIALLTDLFDRANPLLVPRGDTMRVAALIDDGEQRVDALTAQPAVQARMWRVLGRMRLARGEYLRAKALLERAWQSARRQAGTDDHVDVAGAYHDLARATLFVDGSDAARPMLLASLARMRRLPGVAQGDVVAAWQDLIGVTNDPSRHRALLDTLSAVRQVRTHDDSLQLAGTFNALAGRWLSLRPREAQSLYEASQTLVERLLPAGHPIRLTVLRNLTVALTNSGDYHRADSLTRVTLALSAAGGTDDAGAPSRSVTQLANYAVLRAHLGDLDVADSLGREALDIYRATRSSRHDEVGNAQRNLALIAAARGRHAEGLARFDTVIAWHRAAPTSAPPPEARAFIALQRARILLGMGRTVEGARAIDDADPVLRLHLPPLHLYRAELEFWQGMSAVARGDAAAAVGRFDSASALFAHALPSTHPSVAGARCGHFVASVRAARPLGAGAASPTRPSESEGESCRRYATWGMADRLLVSWSRDALAR